MPSNISVLEVQDFKYLGVELSSGKKVHLRPFNSAEEEVLGKYEHNKTALRWVFTRCVQEPIDFHKWTDDELDFLGVFLWGLTYGPDAERTIIAPCGLHFVGLLDLNMVSFTRGKGLDPLGLICPCGERFSVNIAAILYPGLERGKS